MSLSREIKRRAQDVLGPLLSCMVVGYFVFHAIEGDRGVLAWRALDDRIAVAEESLAIVKGERQYLEQRVAMLHPDSIDPDLLSERARVVLNYLHRNDLVLSDQSLAIPVEALDPVAELGSKALPVNAKTR